MGRLIVVCAFAAGCAASTSPSASSPPPSPLPARSVTANEPEKPAVPVVLTNDVYPARPAADATHVYFFSYEGRYVLYRVPESGGERQRLASFGSLRSGPVVDATSVYVATDWKIFRLPKIGAEPTEIAKTVQGEIKQLDVDATSVYFRDGIGLHAVPKEGGEVKTLDRSEYLTDFALASDAVYLVSDGSSLARLVKQTGSETPITSVPAIKNLVVDGRRVCWSTTRAISCVRDDRDPATDLFELSEPGEIELYGADARGIDFTISDRGLFHLSPNARPTLVSKDGVASAWGGRLIIERTSPGTFRLVHYRRQP